MTYKYVATCLFGLEHMLGEEIDALGYKRINTIDGRVVFEGDEAAVARCNIGLRFAERLFYLVGECRAATFEQLFEGTKSMEWENFIGERDEFPVKGHSIKSALFSIPPVRIAQLLPRRSRVSAAETPAGPPPMTMTFFLDRASVVRSM